jgi:hypothetical protein
MLQREFGVTIRDPREGRKILNDVNSMIAFIEQQKAS